MKSIVRKSLAVGIVILAAKSALAMGLDDFLPPSQGGPTAPSGQVNAKADVITANTMQDGMSYAYKEILSESGNGVRTINTKTGIGVIASATANYRLYENINATLLSKRGAYLKAYTSAQGRLTQYFKGLESNCTMSLDSQTVAIDTGTEGRANTAISSSETCTDIVKGVLAAYILYAASDDTKANEVTVAIASSSKTRSAVSRAGGAVIVSSDPNAVFVHIAREISSGLVPPMGAKIINNPQNGEAIIIGFGSAIIRQNPDKSMMGAMRAMAQRQAEIRASSALVSFMNGSDVYWKGGFDEKQIEAAQQFDVPKDQNGQYQDPVVFDKTRNNFLNVVQQRDEFKVLTSGKLPPGVKTKTFASEDGFWMNSISIYMLSATVEAERAASENDRAAGQLNKGPSSGSPVSPALPLGRSMQMEGGVVDGGANPQGPTGRAVKGNDF